MDDHFGQVRPGDVLRMRKFEHCQGTTSLSYVLPRNPSDRYAVMLFLGTESDENPMDLEAIMNRMGWVRAEKTNEPDNL